MLHKWCQLNDLDGDKLIGTSETGYLNDGLAIDWLHHFIHHTKNRRAGAWILLVIDGFGWHSTLLFFGIGHGQQNSTFWSTGAL